jgi:acyl-CoA synthetase (AMP-forming)/AMP-acid ligase II
MRMNGNTERRWHKVWPAWVPKTLDVEKPTSEYVRDWGRLRPDAIALSYYGRDISYGELNGLIDRTAWALVNLGVKTGDRVAIHMGNSPQFVIAYFAVQRAGGTAVPVSPMFKQAELEYEIGDAGAETLIGLDSLYPEIEKVRSRTLLKNIILSSLRDYLRKSPLCLPAEAKEEKHSFANTLDFFQLVEKSVDRPICNVTEMKKEVALLQYTGGTTGTPNGAMIRHYALASASVGMMHWYHNRENDVFLGVTPFFHVMGQVAQMCSALVCGGRLIVLSRFVPDVVAQAIMHYRCTHWVGATTMMIGFMDLPNLDEYDFSSLRCVVTGGPVSVELQKNLNELLPEVAIVEGYGLTESTSQGGACTPLYRYKPGFVGIPQLNVDMKIVDHETGTKELGPNEAGEIIIQSTALMLGYWNKPEETKQMLREGWLHTGDTGLMDEEGYVKFLGRKRELIKCSGFSVFPAEVEDLLYRHPAVKEAAVIGVSDPYRGETPKAFIVPKEEYAGRTTVDEILEWCKDNMAAYKRPRFIEFRKELPKSGSGKILKRVLAEEEKENPAGQAPQQK